MKVIFRKDIVASVPKSFREQYAHYDRGHRFPFGTLGETLAALDAAKDNADIERSLPSWCTLECDECGKDVPALLRIGEDPDYEARWRDVCPACLEEAVRIMRTLTDANREHGR